jgi:ABC-type nitrate/sulfonate/bicarbonate transport system permease component
MGVVAAGGRSTRSLRTRARLLRWATLGGLLIGWEVVAGFVVRGNGYIAPPTTTLTEGVAGFLREGGGLELWQTTSRYLIAFAFVAACGPLIGLALGRLGGALFGGARDVLSVLFALPMVPFYPLLVLWFGLGAGSEVVFGVIHGLVPVVLMTMVASRSVSPALIDSGRAMGANRWQILVRVAAPAVLPDVMGALKVGGALTLLGVLLGELMITVDGVGAAITGAIANSQATILTAIVSLVCLGAVVVNALLAAIERQFSFWRQ